MQEKSSFCRISSQKRSETVNEGELYVQLIVMPQHNQKDTDWLKEEGYFYLGSGVYYSIIKADDFIASYEGPLIKKIVTARMPSQGWDVQREIGPPG